MAVYIVLLGPPGAGKGTQAKVISEKMHIAHISSGDLFRENLKEQNELGKLAQEFINRGELVPDDVTIAMVRERLLRPDCKNGALLDGFPRNPVQADALSKILAGNGESVTAVPYIAVASEVLVERLGGRWSCRAGGHVYHEKNNPPRQAGICDIDGSELYQREDDQPETVKYRIRVFLEKTAPLIEYYRQKGLLFEVDGNRPIEVVSTDILAHLETAV